MIEIHFLETENPLTGTLTNSEDLDEMQHKAVFHKGLQKTIFRESNTILFRNYNLLPLSVYNGPSQVYCMKPEGRIHWYTRVNGTYLFKLFWPRREKTCLWCLQTTKAQTSLRIRAV